MEQNTAKFYKNRGLKRFYIGMPILTVVWIVLFGIIAPSKSTIISFIVISIFLGVFSKIQKYALTNDNTIEFYSFWGRRKKLSVPIESISEILIKPYKLSIDYRTREDIYSRSVVLELSETDMKKMVDELLTRNPKIVVS